MWKFLRGGATVIPWGTFIPESRVAPKMGQVKKALYYIKWYKIINH